MLNVSCVGGFIDFFCDVWTSDIVVVSGAAELMPFVVGFPVVECIQTTIIIRILTPRTCCHPDPK